MVILLALGAVAGCAGVAPAGPAAPESTPVAEVNPSGSSSEVCPTGRARTALEAINRIRSDRGLGSLRPNAELTEAAEVHARDLADHEMRGHRGSDGSMPAQRATRAGYRWTLVGENVAGGYSSPGSVVGGWMASPPHRETLLQAGFREAGIAWADAGAPTGFVWVLVLGDRMGIPDEPLTCSG